MSVEPTSALTFSDLLLETALKAGIAYYGESGNELAQIPVDIHDLAECKRYVNNALRMFVGDAPESGWRWTRPVGAFTLWSGVDELTGRTVSGGVYDAVPNETVIVASDSVFYETMEDASLVVFGGITFRIKRYVSATQVSVVGDASGVIAQLFSIPTTGDYTLPRGFAGSYGGKVTFARNTNQLTHIDWVDEAEIRRLRNQSDNTSGYPIVLAIKQMETMQPGDRRRYVIASYPIAYSDVTVEFKYHRTAEELDALTDAIPSPLVHDETLRAACRAVVERDMERITDGPDWQYYRGNCLPNSHQYDSRSGPRRLGYFGNPTNGNESPHNAAGPFRRPNVTFET